MRAWAITNDNNGLYTGTAPTMRAAIAQHVWSYDERLFNKGWPHIQRYPLTAIQREVWKRCQARGDRAVKVKIQTI